MQMSDGAKKFKGEELRLTTKRTYSEWNSIIPEDKEEKLFTAFRRKIE